MAVLSWDRPERVMSGEEYRSMGACGAPPGVYQNNMSDDDARKWRAKLAGTKSGPLRVEIRKFHWGVNISITVFAEDQHPDMEGKFSYRNRLSLNGTLLLSDELLGELTAAIKEAKVTLSNHAKRKCTTKCKHSPTP